MIEQLVWARVRFADRGPVRQVATVALLEIDFKCRCCGSADDEGAGRLRSFAHVPRKNGLMDQPLRSSHEREPEVYLPRVGFVIQRRLPSCLCGREIRVHFLGPFHAASDRWRFAPAQTRNTPPWRKRQIKGGQAQAQGAAADDKTQQQHLGKSHARHGQARAFACRRCAGKAYTISIMTYILAPS